MGESRRNHHYRIKNLFIYPEKRAKAISVEEMELLKEVGIRGDVHADGSDRQISLLTEELKNWMEKQETEGFCFRKYKENILFEDAEKGDGEEAEKMMPGMLLEAGDVVLEVTGSLKTCHPELCTLIRSGNVCRLAGLCSFAKVKEGGTIRTGMDVTVSANDSGRDEKNE